VVDTLIPDGAGIGLAERVAAVVDGLPAADQAQLGQLLGLFESRLLNLLFSGAFRPFTRMDRGGRERFLGSWATSRLNLRRSAFQALKRITAVTHYTATDDAGRNPAWATLGYPGPLSAPPPKPKTITPLAIDGDTTLECDVVVVGSGAGGGVVAGELARAGKRVIVLEKGGYFNEADFTQREGEMLARLYDAGGLLATKDLGLVILQGSCLGGGTVVNYTTSFHTPDAVRQSWAREHGLPHFTSADFTRHLDAVAQRIHVNTDHAAPSARDRILIRGLERCGWHHGLLPRDVDGCPQDDACGYCGYGCQRSAKRSTLVTYLQDAADHGASFVVGAEVRRVTRAEGRATGVEALVRVEGAPRPFTLSVRAKHVVVAAGSIHTPALLLRSGIRHPALGRHLVLHPATALLGLMDEPVRPWTGALQAHFSDQFADLRDGFGFKFETAPMHPSLAALALPWETGAGYRDAMARLPHLTLVGILLRDRFGGRVRVNQAGAPVVDYALSRYDREHLWRAVQEAARLLEEAGAREIAAPQSVSRWYRPADGSGARARWLDQVRAAGLRANQVLMVTFHQMGSCRMGGNRTTSVVNPDNQVWDTTGLHVADASVFPSASGVNPMLTIMGIAHRAAEIISHQP
jgi:choline dehydrogenase-like flavoprotein